MILKMKKMVVIIFIVGLAITEQYKKMKKQVQFKIPWSLPWLADGPQLLKYCDKKNDDFSLNVNKLKDLVILMSEISTMYNYLVITVVLSCWILRFHYLTSFTF